MEGQIEKRGLSTLYLQRERVWEKMKGELPKENMD